MAYTMYTPLNVWLDTASVTDVVAYIQHYLSENTIYSEEEIEELIHDYLIAHPELIGGVQSVNGKTGTVVLSASDINTANNVTIESVLSYLSSQISSIASSVATNTSNITSLTGRVSTAETDLSNLKSSVDKSLISNGTNLFETGTKQILTRYINVSNSTLGADTKQCPAIIIEPNALYAVSCDVKSHKRLGTSFGYASGIKLTNVVDGSTDNQTLYIQTGNTDKYLFIQLYTDADTVKDASVYYQTLAVRKIKNIESNELPSSNIFENAYVNNSGSFVAASSGLEYTTRYYINSNIRFIRCDSPYKVKYHQYNNDNNADFSFNNTYVGSSDASAQLIIPDNSYRYRVSIVYANGSESTPMTIDDINQHVYFETGDFVTRYGKSAYFAPFVISKNYYPTYQSDFSYFDKDTTTAQLYSKIDEVIAASSGYITKTNLGLSSDGTTQLIRLDCVENGVGAARTARNNKPKIIIIAGLHGGEKCSCYSLYYLLKDLVENWEQDTSLEWIKYNAHLIIIPVANPYGFDRVVYENANSVNLNRNYVFNFDLYGSGSAPLSEPETQIIANLVKKERSAIYLADYHCQGDGTVLPADGRPNWHDQLQTYDPVHDSIGECSKTHIDNISRHWWSEYTFLDPATYGSCGQVETGFWATGLPTLQGYASRNGIVSNTFEALNGFTGRTGFGAEGAKACTELIGNWIIAVLEHFSKYYNCSIDAQL